MGGSWLRRGQILGDRYRVEETLGRGGMGVVVAATDLDRARRVALKVPHRDVHDIGRFLREARAAARITSPHVVRILETGAFPAGDTTVPFIALEYLHGADLARWLAAHGPASIGTAAALVVQACHAIDEAHGLGIVHRDLKPANLFLTTSGVKVLDFGISKSRDDEGNRLTKTGALVGSPAYMPPEQMRPSQTVDARGDIWSLGVVLYEAVTGRLPFESAVFPDLCLKILLDDVPAIDGAPAPFVEVVRRCLEKEPEDRYQSAADLAGALAPFVEPLELALVAREDRGDLVPVSRRAVHWGLWAAILAAVWLVPDASSQIAIFAPVATTRADVTTKRIPTIAKPLREQPVVQIAPAARSHVRSRELERAAARSSTALGRDESPPPNLAPLRDEPAQAVVTPVAKDPLASPF